MAGSGPARDAPDLNTYQAAQGYRALWNGVKLSVESYLNFQYDYNLTFDQMGFLSSNPNIIDGNTWSVVRPLGSGGFGMVGLWHAVDAEGNVVDEMAIKQARALEVSDISRTRRGLAREAVYQYQLNERNTENVVRLRRYKYYRGEQKYRFYLEYCPHGDLERLRYRYRNWGTLLPELFLWHVFHSLAEAIASMEGPWVEFITGRHHDPLWNMLHLDLKPQNVFLSEPPNVEPDSEADPTSDYPGVKVGDFGLSAITGGSDDRNPDDFWIRGTEGYLPPVGFLQVNAYIMLTMATGTTNLRCTMASCAKLCSSTYGLTWSTNTVGKSRSKVYRTNGSRERCL